MKAGSQPKKKSDESDVPKVRKTAEQIREEQGRLVAAFATATEKQRLVLFAAFTSLGWVLSQGAENPVRVAIERTKWDIAREKREKEEREKDGTTEPTSN